MKLLDVYCGMGGWSDGFAREGFECLGIDIVNVGYPYDLILQDARTVDGERFKGFDVIVGSPPCREFSTLRHGFGHRWKKPPNLQEGLGLVHAFLRIVRAAQPKIWIMENVLGLQKHLDLKPQCTVRMTPTMRRTLWGHFPLCLIPTNGVKQPIWKGRFTKLRSWERAKIPLATSQTLAKAIAEHLKGGVAN